MTSRLVDIGANLTHESFAGDLEAVLRRAAEAGVERLVVTGSSLTESRRAAALAATYADRLAATAGVHPHHAKDHDGAALEELQTLLAAPRVKAVGETGLDFNRNFSPPEDQVRVFEAQLALAARSGMPVFLHERDAHERFFEILARYRDRLVAAVVHCFTGSRAELKAYLGLDLYIGITGWICDERRGRHLHDIVHLVPDDRLMLETDAPYLLPRNLRPRPKSRRNEPAYLPHVLRAVAEARHQPADELAAITTANAERFFGLDTG